MDKTYEQLAAVLEMLQKKEIDPIVYGSVAVSLYLGKYKEKFEDYDLLVSDEWIDERWDEFVQFMAENDYRLTDAREHVFASGTGVELNLAKESVLSRDGICDPAETVRVRIAGMDIKTLNAQNLLKAYEFSVRDGYRNETRGKKDEHVVKALTDYVSKNS